MIDTTCLIDTTGIDAWRKHQAEQDAETERTRAAELQARRALVEAAFVWIGACVEHLRGEK